MSEPGKGIHSYRIYGFAAFDIIATGCISFLFTRYKLHRTDLLTHTLVFIILILLGIILHRMLSINTKLNSFIFK